MRFSTLAGVLLCGVVVVLLAGGCMVALKNHGEVGFRTGTEFTFFHRASKTSDEAATSSLEADAILERFVPLAGEDDTTDGT